jgi:hydroxymethylglutaryl-CoA lyase
MFKDHITIPNSVNIVEVGPRDGLQNLDIFVPTSTKHDFINKIINTGIRNIEITSFVNPTKVPQMQDARELALRLNNSNITFKVLIPNRKGLAHAIKAGVKNVVAVISASETHNKNNVNMTIQESLSELNEMARSAQSENIHPTVNIATAFGCEYEGNIPIERLIYLSQTLEGYGYETITLCDTTGIANPVYTYELCSQLVKTLRNASVGVHFHKCNGIEYANVMSALLAGVNTYESAFGGLGGCPFAPGATGNIATENLIKLFNRMNIETNVNLSSIEECARYALDMQKEYSGKNSDIVS